MPTENNWHRHIHYVAVDPAQDGGVIVIQFDGEDAVIDNYGTVTGRMHVTPPPMQVSPHPHSMWEVSRDRLRELGYEMHTRMEQSPWLVDDADESTDYEADFDEWWVRYIDTEPGTQEQEDLAEEYLKVFDGLGRLIVERIAFEMNLARTQEYVHPLEDAEGFTSWEPQVTGEWYMRFEDHPSPKGNHP